MEYDDHLERWTEAGLIDGQTAAAIRAFEAQRKRGTPGVERPSLVEAILYLGLLVVAAGVFALFAQNWAELQSPARVAAVGIPAALALVLGFGLRTTRDAAFVRGGHIAWLVSLSLLYASVLVVFNEYQSSDDERAALLAGGLAGLGLSVLLWAISNSAPQVIGVAASFVAFSEALGAWPDDYSAAIAGTTILICGAIGIALAEERIFRPGAVAMPLFGLLAAAGAYHAGLDGKLLWAELMAFVVAGGLAALSLWRGGFGYMLAAVALAFVTLVTFIFEYFENEIGAPVALMISGAALVAGVLLLIPLRRITREPAA
jgi:hypothetical protein